MKEFTKCEKNDILFDEIITLVEEGVIPPDGAVIKVKNWYPDETPYWQVEYPYSLDQFDDIDDFIQYGIYCYCVPKDLMLGCDWPDLIADGNTWEMSSYSEAEADNFGQPIEEDKDTYTAYDSWVDEQIDRNKLRRLGLDD